MASVIAESPPPITTTTLSLKKKPSHVAQYETPLPINSISPFAPSFFGVVPEAIITDFASMSPSDVLTIFVFPLSSMALTSYMPLISSPNLRACCSNLIARSAPDISRKPGKFSTRSVTMICPPIPIFSMRRASSIALFTYMPAVRPAGPPPIITTSCTIFVHPKRGQELQSRLREHPFHLFRPVLKYSLLSPYKRQWVLYRIASVRISDQESSKELPVHMCHWKALPVYIEPFFRYLFVWYW